MQALVARTRTRPAGPRGARAVSGADNGPVEESLASFADRCWPLKFRRDSYGLGISQITYRSSSWPARPAQMHTKILYTVQINTSQYLPMNVIQTIDTIAYESFKYYQYH